MDLKSFNLFMNAGGRCGLTWKEAIICNSKVALRKGAHPLY